MFLELINYDIEGAAWNEERTAIVDGAALMVTVKRRAETAQDGVDGFEVPLRINLATLKPSDKTALLAAYQTIEDIVRAHADVEYAAKQASPETLDEKIAEARRAETQKATLQVEIAALEARKMALEATDTQSEAVKERSNA